MSEKQASDKRDATFAEAVLQPLLLSAAAYKAVAAPLQITNPSARMRTPEMTTHTHWLR